MQTGLPCCLTVPFRGALLHRMRLGVRCRRRRLERSRKDDAVALNSLLGLHVGRDRVATLVNVRIDNLQIFLLGLNGILIT